MADVTTEEERASIFFRFGVASMAADFISSAVSSWLMTMDPWIPLMIGMAIVLIGVLFTLSLPETMHARHPEPADHMEMSHLSPDDEDNLGYKEHDQEYMDNQESPFIHPKESNLKVLASKINSYITPYTFILANKQILLLLSAFLVYRLSRGSSWFLVQYISTRYNWTLAQSNLLMSFRPALTIPLFLFILPAISRYLLRSMQSTQKDLRLARISIIFLTVGTLGIGLSPSIPPLIISLIVQAAGSGFLFVTRSLITTLIKREQTAKLFTVIEILQSVGAVIASLVITNVFRAGIEMGGVWIGLAWFVTGSLFVAVGVAVWVVRIPVKEVDGEDVGEDPGAGERYFD
ncbi:MFS transporter [Aspergillus sclerotialis]|uniref:MFS transporter n=1 Tax=Aspergillus sclerotialis TaxID=2070753 RepID=A0A3A2ZUS5_9EURO|nr:MFS transporter [Aspergillus sclerotialis]